VSNNENRLGLRYSFKITRGWYLSKIWKTAAIAEVAVNETDVRKRPNVVAWIYSFVGSFLPLQPPYYFNSNDKFFAHLLRYILRRFYLASYSALLNVIAYSLQTVNKYVF